MLDETPCKLAKKRRFLQSYRGRIAMALLLIAVVLAVQVALIAIPYQLEQRIAEKIKSIRGQVQYKFNRPNWIPQFVQDNFPVCGSISTVILNQTDQALPPELLAEIGSLRGLESLWLLGSQITDDDLEKLKPMTHLTGLYIGYCPVTDKGVEHLNGLTNLKWLFLSKTQVGDEGLKTVSRLTKLKSVSLMDTDFSDAGMENLKGLAGLEILNVEGTDVSDDGLKHFMGMTSLKRLDLGKTLVTPEGKAMIQNALPSCSVGMMSARTPKMASTKLTRAK